MILDTESTEGKALVALAKYADKVLMVSITHRETVFRNMLLFAAICDGLMEYSDADRHSWIRTDLAKLPEGI